MDVEFDPAKRQTTLAERGLDMAEAGSVFEDVNITFDDPRFAYGERRQITIGFLEGRMVVLAWTQRGAARRIISMRKANEREQARYGPRF